MINSFAAASVYKLWLAYQVLHEVDLGRLDLDTVLTIAPEDTVEPEPASGVSLGDEMTVWLALELMMGSSSNAAGLIETPAGPLIVSIFDEGVDPGVVRAVIADIAVETYRFYAGARQHPG